MTYVAVYYLHPPARWWGAAIASYRWSFVAAGITLAAVLMSRKKLQPPTIPVFRHPVMTGMLLFLAYIVIQSAWALDPQMHQDMVSLFAKYALLVGLIYVCVDSEQHLKMFLWVHVLGCMYLGWIAHTSYDGGRFEGFGGPDINEANAGALQIVTGIFAGSALFLAGTLRERVVLLCGMPLVANALVTTVSRSGFLEASAGGLVLNRFVPARFRKAVFVLSLLAVGAFLMITNASYWDRMDSLKYAGEEVQGVDTGGGRLVLIEAQWRMFQQHLMGCGHRCTAVLSPQFLDDSRLTGTGANRARSSHNSLMTMLVEHGILGGIFYFSLVLWVVRSIIKLRRQLKDYQGLLATLLSAVAAMLAAIIVGDLFVDYVLQEVRMWAIGLLMATLSLAERIKATEAAGESAAAVAATERKAAALSGSPSALAPPASSSARARVAGR